MTVGLAGAIAVILADRSGRADVRVAVLAGAVGALGIVAAYTAVSSAEARARRSILFGRMLPAYYSVIFGFSAVTFLSPRHSSAEVDAQAVIAVGPLVVLGISAWWLGYRAGSSRHLAAAATGVGSAYARPQFSSPIETHRILALYAVASLMRIGSLLRGSFGYLEDPSAAIESASVVNQLLSFGAELAPLSLLLLALKIFTSDSSGVTRATFCLMIAVELVAASFSGQKNPFLFVGLAIVLAGIATNRLSWRHVMIWATVGSVIIFPFNEHYRALLRPAPGVRASSTEAVSLFKEAVGQSVEGFASPVETGHALMTMLERLREIDAFAVAVAAHDSGLPYSSPSEPVTRVLTLSIPRIVWPSKPVDLYSLQITRDYYKRPPQILSSSTLSILGDAYRHGGAFALILGMGTVGLLSRILDMVFDPRRHPVLLMPFVALIPLLRQGDIAGMVVAMVRTCLLMLPVLWFITRTTSRPRHDA